LLPRRLARAARALSLDVVGGALCGGMLAESVTGAQMRLAWWVALACAVWVVYTLDHLLDARRAQGGLAYRHRFHRRHARVLVAAAALLVVLGAGAACFLRPSVLRVGLGLAAGCALYLASAQGLLLPVLPKEPVAALFYAAGIWVGPLAVAPRSWAWAACALHALGALLNLLAYGVLEARLDARQQSRSLARLLGDAPARRLVLAGSLLGALVACALGSAAPGLRLAFVVLAIVVAAPGVLLSRWFARHERYRIWGDLVFWLGAVPWLAR
jgi:hypothetical protein